MVVRDNGSGHGPLESNLEDCCCIRSEKPLGIDGSGKNYSSCSRRCRRSRLQQRKHSTEVSGRSIADISQNGVSPNPNIYTDAQSLGFEGGSARALVHNGHGEGPEHSKRRNKTKGPEHSKRRNKTKGRRLVSLVRKKTRITPLSAYSPSIRLSSSNSIENGDHSGECEANSIESDLLQGILVDSNTDDGGIKFSETNASLLPGLGDDVALLCLVRLSRSLYGSYFPVSKRFCSLFKSDELYKLRRDLGISEQWVYLLNSGQSVWRAFDPKDGGRWRPLPPTPSDHCFLMSDKESLTAGTQLLVLGREIQGFVVWVYDLVSDSWFPGPPMNTPRCLYASASWREYGFVAGGVDRSLYVINCAERYSSVTRRWEALPPMLTRRKLCSGFYMDGKFWVIGGIDEKDTVLTCGEGYDPKTKTWTLIPNMFPRSGGTAEKAPPLVAVVDNQLYALDVSVNQLKLYCKKSNTWKLLGDVPVRADFNSGWGLAFKALEGQLLLIEGYCPPGNRDGDAIYAWKPSSEGHPEWRFVAGLVPRGTFVLNCAVMSA